MKVLNIIGLWLCTVAISITSYAQRNDVLLTNSKSTADNPYEGIEGSPYYFKDWKLGKIYPKTDSEPIQEVLLNFNGYTQNFEIKKDNRYIAVDEQWYQKVEIERGASLHIYKLGVLPSQAKQFVRVLFEGASFQVLQDFQVSLTTREKQSYGKMEEVQLFNPHQKYYFVQNGKRKLFKLKKKSVLSLFPKYKSSLEKYAKKHRLQWKEETDLIALFTYYEELSRAHTLSSTGKE